MMKSPETQANIIKSRAWLKKHLASTLTRSERLAIVERVHSELPLSDQVDLLSISRSSLYYRPMLPPPEEVTIKDLIDGIYTARPLYGSRRLMFELRKKGFTIARKTVQCYVHEMGITAVVPGPNLSRHDCYDDLQNNERRAIHLKLSETMS
jgi:putative transposase